MKVVSDFRIAAKKEALDRSKITVAMHDGVPEWNWLYAIDSIFYVKNFLIELFNKLSLIKNTSNTMVLLGL